MAENTFPVQTNFSYRDGMPKVNELYPDCPTSLPYDLVAAHDRQCQRNHGGQTVARLKERGGLCPIETWAVLNDKPYPWDGDLPAKLEHAVLYLKAVATSQ